MEGGGAGMCVWGGGMRGAHVCAGLSVRLFYFIFCKHTLVEVHCTSPNQIN